MVAEPTQRFFSGLEGRHAIVTGGARGLGHAIAKSLVAAGASVSVLDNAVPETSQQGVAVYSTDIRDMEAGFPAALKAEIMRRAESPQAQGVQSQVVGARGERQPVRHRGLEPPQGACPGLWSLTPLAFPGPEV